MANLTAPRNTPEYADQARRQCEEEKPRVQAELEQRQQEQARLEEQARQAETAEAARKVAEEAARKEAERIAAEEAARQAEVARQAEAARLEAERKAAEEAARVEAERLAAEEAARQERERLAAEKVAQSTEQQAISEQQTIYDITDSKKDKQNENNSKVSPLAPPVNESKEQSTIRLSRIADIVKRNIEVIFGENTCLITDKWFPDEEKTENDETHILGKCVPISDVRISGGKRYITYISSKAKHPLITATHEHIHALIDSGFFSQKALRKVEEALKHTRTYFNCCGNTIRGSKHDKRVNEKKHYKSYYRTEMLIRALTWFACVYSVDEKIHEEVLAYLNNEDKLHEIDRDPNVWFGFKKDTDIYDTKLEQVIMKRISKPSWLIKLLRRIGFADFVEDKDDWYIKWYDETYKGKTREEIRREAQKRLEGIPRNELVKRNPEVFGEM